MITSPSAWTAATASIGDTFRTFSLHPIAYAAIFAITSVQQFLVSPQSFKSPEQLTASDQLVAVCVILGTVLLLPFTIALIRYFAAGDLDHGYSFRRPFLRFLGWTLLLSILGAVFFLALALVAGIAGHIAPVLGAAVGVAGGVLGMWCVLRLGTFFQSVALDEAPPLLKRAFSETKGYAWFILVTLILMMLFMVPLMLILFGFYALVGFPAPEPGQALPPFGFGLRLAEAVIVGVFSTLTTVYCAAVAGRVFRAIRGSQYGV